MAPFPNPGIDQSPSVTRNKFEPKVNLRWFSKREMLSLMVVILIGLVHLPLPFHDDQTFFTVAAIKLNQGALLYRDYWDIKQPGIFVFYLLGGKLFGFNEVGIHTLEMLTMAGLAAVLIVTLRNYFKYAWSTAVVGLLTVGFYYGISGLPHLTQDYLTQVEGLVGLPMFLCLWLTSDAMEGQEWRWGRLFLSGMLGACVLLMKLLFLPMVLSFWAATFLYSAFHNRKNIVGGFIRFFFPVALGLSIPLLAVWAYFAWRGGLNDLYYTTFVWPVRALGRLPLAGVGRLHEGVEFFIDGYAPLLALEFLGTWWSLRRRKNILTINLLIWIVVGAMVVLVQRRSWWPYQFLLFFVPLGILATRGVERLWDLLQSSGAPEFAAPRRRALMVATILILMFSPVIYPIFTDAMLLAAYRFGVSSKQRLDFQCRFTNSQYPSVLTDVAFLSKPDSLPGPIYVGGSPLYYLLSGRQPAIVLSYGLDDLLPEQWIAFHQQLTAARPVYVFLHPTFHEWIQQSSPETLRFIEQNYDVLQCSPSGTWYALKGAAASAATIPRPPCWMKLDPVKRGSAVRFDSLGRGA